MNGQRIHDAMVTFMASQLAMWEGREEDADYLGRNFEGDQRDMISGAYTLASWIVVCLATERDEEPTETARAVLRHLADADVHAHVLGEQCDECGEFGTGHEGLG